MYSNKFNNKRVVKNQKVNFFYATLTRYEPDAHTKKNLFLTLLKRTYRNPILLHPKYNPIEYVEALLDRNGQERK